MIFGDEVWQDRTSRVPVWERPVGYVFQDARLFPHLNVGANLDYAARRARKQRFAREQIIAWLHLEALLERDCATLSAGQQQRLAIGRALMSGPELLVLDEPLANLDRAAARDCLACLARIHRESTLPMVYVSHQIEEVYAIASRVVILDKGRVSDSGPLLELAGRIDSALADDEAAAAILRASVRGTPADDGLCELEVDGQTLWISSDGQGGASYRLRVPSRDVSVCRERPQQTSILNILSVTLEDIREISPAHCLLRLRLKDQHLLARITQRSCAQLQLCTGDELFAQIKSTALIGEDADS